MSWAEELLQTTQQCATTTSESPPLRVLTRWSPASAQLPVWNLMQALALMHWLRSCWLAAAGLPPEDEAAGAGLAAGTKAPEKGAPRGAAEDGGTLTEGTLKPPEYEVRISTSVSHKGRVVPA